MSNKEPDSAITDYRARFTFWFSIFGTFILAPFTINNFIQGRYALGLLTLAINIVIGLQAWTIYRKQYVPLLTSAVMAPSIIVFLALVFERLGALATYWCYPSVIVFYFMLRFRHAVYANIALMLVAVPSAWFVLELSHFTRFAATLLYTSVFSSIFVYIIERQHRELGKLETQRRDGMVSASHEIRTPLATQMAQIAAMRDGKRPLDHEQLKILMRSTRHMSELVDDLYALSLADANKLVEVRQDVQLDRVLQEAIVSVAVKIKEKNLLLHPTIEPNIWVSGDEKCLRQIIDNLLENCYRYTETGGEVSLSLKRRPGKAELCITDTGPGVSDDVLPCLFDRFYRVERSRSRKMGGAGLGLALVQSMTQAHWGEVSAFHAAEGGLGISVILPVVDKHGQG